MSITIEKVALCDLLNRVLPFASPETARPTWGAVELEVADGYLTATTTDGYRLAHARSKLSTKATPWKFVLKLRDAQQTIRLFRTGGRRIQPISGQPVTVGIKGNFLNIADTGPRTDDPPISVQFTEHASGFVKWRSLIPSGVPLEETSVDLNAQFLADFRHVPPRNTAIRVTTFGANRPILVQAQDFVGLLMPIRRDPRDTPLGFDVFTGDEIHIGVTIDPAFHPLATS